MIFRLLMLLLTLSLHAKLEDHFKKALGKTDFCNMRNIDYIYIINLDQRPEKFARCAKQLYLWGINPYRFSAVNGWELSLETVNDIGVRLEPWMTREKWGTFYPIGGDRQPNHEPVWEAGKTYFSHCMSLGAIGIDLSHLSVLQDALDSGYETIWVMEDDIQVVRDPRILSTVIEKLDAEVGKDNWDILFTDKDIRDVNGNYIPVYFAGRRPDYLNFTKENNYSLKNPVGEFIKIGARSGAHSMIIRRSGIQKLLRFFNAHQIFFPYDMEYILPRGINLYTVAHDIVSNLPKALSDNGGPNYKQDNK